MSWKVTFRLQADPSAFRIIRKLAAEAARAEGLPSSESSAVEVAVGETLAGAYHAYGRGTPLELELEFDGLRLIITLHDDGTSPFDAAHVRDRGSEPGRRLHLIRHLVDEAEIIPVGSTGQGKGIRLRKKLV